MNTGPKPIEMVGKKFGKLTVLSLDHKTKTDRYWRCQCDCGDLKVADGAELRRGTTTHCGCSNPKIKDITGQRFTRLLVLRRDFEKAGKSSSTNSWWKCLCDCGKEVSVSFYRLSCGNTKSCGCYIQEIRGKSTLKHGQARVGSRTVEYTMWAHAKKRAREKSFPFDIEPKDIIIPERCPIFGVPLASNKGGSMTANSPSLDRLVPSLGYVRGNIDVISRRANTIKNDSTLEELKLIVDYVERRSKGE